MWMHAKNVTEIQLIHLGNKEIYYIFETCCITSVLFSTKCRVFHNFVFCVEKWLVFVHKPCTKI